jgi:propanol-preferring alcohol dehydrogenase
MAETLAIADEGNVRADIELEPLASINTIFERLERGNVAGRVVLDFMTAKTERTGAQARREPVPA